MKKSLKKFENHKNLRIFFKFYFNYSTKTILSSIIISLIIITDIAIQSLFLVLPSYSTDSTLLLAENYLLLTSPLIISCAIIPIFLSWSLFAKAKKDGTFVFLTTKRTGRKFEFWSKFWFINAISIFISFIITSIHLMFMLSLRVEIYTVLITIISSIIGSLFIVLLFSAFGSIISISFDNIKSIFFSIVIVIIAIIPIFISNFVMSSQGNSTKWNGVDNNVNYVMVEKVDSDGNEISSNVAYIYSNQDKRNNTQPPEQLGSFNKFGFVIDKFILSPLSIFAEKQFHFNDNQILELSKNYNNSLLRTSSKEDGDFSLPKDGNLIAYDLNSNNPVKLSLNEEVNFFEKNILDDGFIKTLPLNFSDEQNIMIFLDKLKTEKIWSRLKLTNSEKKVIQMLIGLSFADKNLFYLFRDLNILGTKYKKFISMIERNNQRNSLMSLIKYLWTDKIARTNILDSEEIISRLTLEKKLPNFQVKWGIKKATTYNILQMKELISKVEINQNKIRIKTSENSWKSLQINNFPIPNISSKSDWDSYIDENNELLTLKNIFQKLSSWISQNSSKINIYDIDFEENALDILSMNGKRKLSLQANSINPAVLLSIMFLIICICTTLSKYLYLRKDIK